ncbi:MAG TPA: SAM-dependent chlorinase/fluorinase [Candidatus Dormibacteraeota bacterium]
MAARAGISRAQPAGVLGAARVPRRSRPLEGDAVLVVTLTSDFGEGSPYVAALKAAVLASCPDAVLVDVTHSLEPFAIDSASFVLWAGTRHFEPGSVHLAVVDPGVGTARRALALSADGRFYVGPDNGLFAVVVEEAQSISAVELQRPPGASPTFEGRDLFAPSAARLSRGEALESLGSKVEISALAPAVASGPRVVWVDRFGNLVLSLRPPVRPLRLGGVLVEELARTFGEAPPGIPFCYEGSMGRLEIGVRNGRADSVIGVGVGARVEDSETS